MIVKILILLPLVTFLPNCKTENTHPFKNYSCEDGQLAPISQLTIEEKTKALEEAIASGESSMGLWHANYSCPDEIGIKDTVDILIQRTDEEILAVKGPPIDPSTGKPLYFSCNALALASGTFSIKGKNIGGINDQVIKINFNYGDPDRNSYQLTGSGYFNSDYDPSVKQIYFRLQIDREGNQSGLVRFAMNPVQQANGTKSIKGYDCRIENGVKN